MISNSQIREKARGLLGKKLFSASWMYPVLVILIVTAVNSLLSGTFVGPIIVTGLLSVAMARYFMNRARGSSDVKDIECSIECVKSNFLGSMLTGILYTLFVTLGSILFIVPGIIFSYSFSMAFYVINDHPEMKAMDALRESHRLMKGHRMQYFMLQLSFIGWELLGSLCLGVGVLWSSTYVNTANAIFYEELLALDGGYHYTTAEEVE